MQNIDLALLKRAVTGQNTADEQAEVERWLAASPEHRAYYERMERFFARDGRESVKVRENFRRFIRRTNAPRRRMTLRIASAIAAACIVGMGVFVLLDGMDDDTSEMIVAGRYGAVLHTGESGAVVLEDGAQTDILTGSGLRVRQHDNLIDYQTQELPIASNTEIHTLETPHGSEYRLRLGDGTQVWLNAESQISYPASFAGDERRVSISGEAYFDVSPSEVPFIVEIDGMEVRVLGTEFNIRSYHNENTAHTTLLHGSVEVTADERTLRLVPGEQALLQRGVAISKRKVDAEKYAAWKEGNIAFDDERLEDIMTRLGRWYNINVEFSNPSLRDIRFTGNIDRYGDIGALLEKIEKLNVVRFAVSGTHITVEKQ